MKLHKQINYYRNRGWADSTESKDSWKVNCIIPNVKMDTLERIGICISENQKSINKSKWCPFITRDVLLNKISLDNWFLLNAPSMDGIVTSELKSIILNKENFIVSTTELFSIRKKIGYHETHKDSYEYNFWEYNYKLKKFIRKDKIIYEVLHGRGY